MMRISIGTLLVLGLVAGCSGTDGADDGRVPWGERAPLPDGYVLWACPVPGQPCNAHDECAIDPICGADKKCYPTKLLSCDDNLSCTKNTCKGLGLCEFTPITGYCSLPVKVGGSTGDGGTKDGGATGQTEVRCFTSGQKNPNDPCQKCDPTTDAKKWTAVNGGPCSDGDKCTSGDYCQSGVCKGTSYGSKCADTLACTDDFCDGNGGCLPGHPLKKDWCLIGGVCYKDNAKHPSGTCQECDVTKSQTQWTTITTPCNIGGKCYGPGDKHPNGTCAECKPGVSATSWTVTATDACLISDVCKKTGDADTTGCAECKPSADKYAWTTISNKCLIDGTCYAENAAHPQGCAACKPATSRKEWTLTATDKCLIGGKCYSNNAPDPIGCAKCDISQSKTSWTKISGCFKIVFAALNEAHDGSLGGLTAANAECAKQAAAAGFAGTFKAFLSTASQNVKDLITGTNATSVNVVNTKGDKMYSNWNEMFTSVSWPTSATLVYTFKGTEVDEYTVTPNWYDAYAFHGSTYDGKVNTGYTCKDWTSNTSTDYGAVGEVDDGEVYWLSPNSTTSCNTTVAVICVQVAP